MVGDEEGFPLLAPGGASKGLEDTDSLLGSVGYIGDVVGEYEPSDMHKVEVLKQRKSKHGLEYLVHYVGWPHTYDEWKLAKDIDG